MPRIAGAITVEHLDRFRRHDFRRCKQDARIEIALQSDPVADTPARVAKIDRPVEADGIATTAGDRFQPQAAAFGKHDDGDAVARFFADQSGDDPLQIRQRKLPVSRGGQTAAPGVEQHQRLSAGFDLGVKVSGHCVGSDRQYAMQQIRSIIEHGLDPAIIAAGAAFDHVAGQGIGAAGEADQGNAVVEGSPDFGNRVGHVTQAVVGVWRGQAQDVPFFAQRALETRSFAFAKIKP